MKRFTPVFVLLSLCFSSFGQIPAPTDVGPVHLYGQHVQRTLQALETSGESARTVRILFYGQSITQQDWWLKVKTNLTARFPNARMEIVNRALPGIEAGALINNAESDLYPYYPDLLIFHVYGDTAAYENIIRRTRARTTAEIILQTDHIQYSNELTEPTDPSAIQPANSSAWRNYVFLPQLAVKYGAELADVRTYWKEYLIENDFLPSQLLSDHIHLNPHGRFLMSELVVPHLRVNAAFPAATNSIKDLRVGRDVHWSGSSLVVPFVGNRVELIAAPTETPSRVYFEIDGKKTSEFPELYFPTRTSYHPFGAWPVLQQVKSHTPRIEEDWSLEILEYDPVALKVRYKATGSMTGIDGEGTSTSVFTSNSGRVVIGPEEWAYSRSLWQRGIQLPVGSVVSWRFFLAGLDSVDLFTTTNNRVHTIASGLGNGSHVLKITGGPLDSIEAVRVFNPKAMTQPESDTVRVEIESRFNPGPMLRFFGQNRFVVEETAAISSNWRPISGPRTDATISVDGRHVSRFYRARVLD